MKKPGKQLSKTRTPASQEGEMRELLDEIAGGKYKKIIVMAGAGISTAAGIPDFRSPHTGLYANLQKYDLPYPEAVFDIDYLRQNPDPFFLLAGEMYPSQFKPTRFHEFLKWLSDLGYLKRVYTQNIDTLERVAGVPAELIVEAHGSFAASSCIDCKREAHKPTVEEAILVRKEVPRCTECEGIVKPDIVFFGEGLPRRFFKLLESDFDDVDLAIVAGTSLQVGPFNQLPDMVPPGTPRVLLNMEKVGSFGRRKDDRLILGPLEKLDSAIDTYIHDSEEAEETRDVSESSGAAAGTKNTKAASTPAEKEASEKPKEKQATEKLPDKLPSEKSANEKAVSEKAAGEKPVGKTNKHDADEDAEEKNITLQLNKLNIRN